MEIAGRVAASSHGVEPLDAVIIQHAQNAIRIDSQAGGVSPIVPIELAIGNGPTGMFGAKVLQSRQRGCSTEIVLIDAGESRLGNEQMMTGSADSHSSGIGEAGNAGARSKATVKGELGHTIAIVCDPDGARTRAGGVDGDAQRLSH